MGARLVGVVGVFARVGRHWPTVCFIIIIIICFYAYQPMMMIILVPVTMIMLMGARLVGVFARVGRHGANQGEQLRDASRERQRGEERTRRNECHLLL